MTEQKTGLDFEAMRRAIEGLDAERLIGLCAHDAQMITVNRYATPSSPKVLSGNEQIAEHLRDECGRAMTHHVEDEVVGEGRVAFNEACEYEDGTRVLASITLDVRDGKVVRQVQVEAWDE